MRVIDSYASLIFTNGFTQNNGLDQNTRIFRLPGGEHHSFISLNVAISADSKQMDEAWNLVADFIGITAAKSDLPMFNANRSQLKLINDLWLSGGQWISAGKDRADFPYENAKVATQIVGQIMEDFDHVPSYSNKNSCDGEFQEVITGKMTVSEGAKRILEKLWRQLNE